MKTMELFDYANAIGGHIEFDGSYSPDNTFVNATLYKGYNDMRTERGHLSVFGRSDDADIDEALSDLAAELSGKMIYALQEGEGQRVPKLTHTKGYRG